MQSKTAFLAAIGAVAIGTSTFAENIQAKEMEKCYGVVKSGMNDCAAADGSHSCAGFARADGEWKEWIALPVGVCERVVGGSLEAANPEAEG